MVGRKARRRGLSAVVGAVFLIIVMVVALNAMVMAMQQQQRVSMAVTGEADTTAGRLNERIEISSIRVESNNKMNMTVSNTGGQAAVLKALYIVDETASPKQQFRYDLNNVVDSRSPLMNIGQNLPFTVSPSSSYSVRVVTATGNSASASFVPASGLSLPMSLYVIPPVITPGEEVTLMFMVSNNSTDAFLATGVTPSMATSCPFCSALTPLETPPSNVKIAKGASVAFKWIYKVDAPDGSVATFTASLQGGQLGNNAVGHVKVENVEVADSTLRIINSDLAQRPEIFLTAPSPFGDNDITSDRGGWAVTVVNPTITTMTVSRVVVSTFTPHFGGSQKIFEKNCFITPIYPSTASEWTCLDENQLEWRDFSTPETVSALNAKTFRAKVEPGSLGSSADEPAYVISVTVFTNMGQFTKTGFAGGMLVTKPAPIVNVYLTNTDDTAAALQNANFLGDKSGVTQSSNATFYIALADFDTNTAKYVKSGAKLIINVPEGFDQVSVPSGQSGFSSAIPTEYGEKGPTQIVATLSEPVGDVSGNAEAKVLRFSAIAPSTAVTKIYIMHVLVDGLTDANFPVGAFTQVPVQVTP